MAQPNGPVPNPNGVKENGFAVPADPKVLSMCRKINEDFAYLEGDRSQKWRFEVVQMIMRVTRKNGCNEQFYEAVMKENPTSRCCPSHNEKLKNPFGRTLSLVLKLFRFPYLRTDAQIKSVVNCAYQFSVDSKEVCLNPWHYRFVEVEKQEIHPVEVNKYSNFGAPPKRSEDALEEHIQWEQLKYRQMEIMKQFDVPNVVMQGDEIKLLYERMGKPGYSGGIPILEGNVQPFGQQFYQSDSSGESSSTATVASSVSSMESSRSASPTLLAKQETDPNELFSELQFLNSIPTQNNTQVAQQEPTEMEHDGAPVEPDHQHQPSTSRQPSRSYQVVGTHRESFPPPDSYHQSASYRPQASDQPSTSGSYQVPTSYHPLGPNQPSSSYQPPRPNQPPAPYQAPRPYPSSANDRPPPPYRASDHRMEYDESTSKPPPTFADGTPIEPIEPRPLFRGSAAEMSQLMRNPDSVIKVPYLESNPYWLKVVYYEEKYKIGQMEQYDSHHCLIDGFSSSSEKVEPGRKKNRFSIGFYTNPNRSEDTKAVRAIIGKGIRVFLLAGEVYVENLGNIPVFVQSISANLTHKFKLNTVTKLMAGGSMKIFDMKLFSSKLAQAAKKTYQDVYSLSRLCTIRLSFCKGWGQSYSRASIFAAPVWFHFHLNNPMEWIDSVLNCMGAPPRVCSSRT